MRTWSGLASAMTFSATVVPLPTYGTGEGIYEDMLHFLNGMGSRSVATAQTLGALTTAAYTGGGTITWGLTSGDLFYVETSGGAATDFTITASTGLSQLGFTSSTYGLVGGATPFRRTAETDWTRGNCSKISITIDPAGAGAAFSVAAQRLQSAITWLRSQDQNDADDQNTASNLERLVQTAVSVHSFRMGISDTGYVWMAWSNGALPAPTWPSASFAARLGFKGDEAIVTTGGVDVVTATYPCPGVYVSTRGLEEIAPGTLEVSSGVRQTNGVQCVNHIGTYKRRTLSIIVDGPAASYSSATSYLDLHRHFLERFVPYVPRGSRLSVYQDWGDPRRALSSFDVTSSQPAYDLLYTAEPLPGTMGTGGYRGRLRFRHSIDASDQYAAQWGSRIRQRMPITMLLDESGD